MGDHGMVPSLVNVLLLGATGMIGQGVLRECLLAPDVDEIVSITRRPIGQSHRKLHELIQSDLSNLTPLEAALGNIDACFFCLGVTSVGLSEQEYTRVTYDLTLSVANTLVKT